MSDNGLNSDIVAYNNKLQLTAQPICDLLAGRIQAALAEATSKIWHAHRVWFLESNPIVGYDKLKHSVRLLFWSGQSFDEPNLDLEGSFKAAEKRYNSVDQIDLTDLDRWLAKSRTIQWDYKNIRKRKGDLIRLA